MSIRKIAFTACVAALAFSGAQTAAFARIAPDARTPAIASSAQLANAPGAAHSNAAQTRTLDRVAINPQPLPPRTDDD